MLTNVEIEAAAKRLRHNETARLEDQLKAANERIEEVLNICSLTPPVTVNKEHSEGWIHLARDIKEVFKAGE